VVKETRHKHASSEIMRQISDGCFGEGEYSLLVYMYILNLVPHTNVLWPCSLMVGSMAEGYSCGRAFIGGASKLLVL